ncbi:MAG: hypothetical protein P9E67_06390 [Candidatus Competibacter sp.]|nr:hypothetical protein [Candidatus Competibacter sp.]
MPTLYWNPPTPAMPHLEWTNKIQAIAQAADMSYRLLRFERGHGDANTNNPLIQGDNLLALKALLPFYRGRVKCNYCNGMVRPALPTNPRRAQSAISSSLDVPIGAERRETLAQAGRLQAAARGGARRVRFQNGIAVVDSPNVGKDKPRKLAA